MILSGNKIAAEVAAGNITIEPFDPRRVNPASFDVTLGKFVAVYVGTCAIPTYSTPGCPTANRREDEDGTKLHPFHGGALDSRKPLAIETWTIGEKGWVLKPGIAYLMHTVERISTEKYVPIIDGKSSIGRLFVKVHETAGFGDPGFDGEFTLEVTCQFPIRVYAGMRIGQVRFHHIDGEVTSYRQKGSYQGERAQGPVPSQAWRSAFDRDDP